MRLRYKLVTYHFGQDASGRQTVQRHYQALIDELLRQGQHPAVNHRTVQWRPPADIHETPEAVLVKMELAGMREEDIEITLYEDALVVTGRRDDDAARDEAVYYHEAQIRYGPFRAEILLPGPVRREEVEAQYANGFLCITLPKVTDPRPGEVRVDVTGAGRRGASSQPQQAGPRARAAGSGAASAPSPVGASPRGARFTTTLRGGPCDA
jgi:HSP20 family molecular chaperone IbpA